MTLLKLFQGLWRQIRLWDHPSQISLGLALGLLVPVALAALIGPPDLRPQARIGAVGLLIAVQVIIMWGNRGMVTPFTQAQRHFLQGEFEEARALLEALHQQGKTDVQALTLLGNTYRQLGQLAASERVLYEARNNYPDHYFPCYGFGRTLLMKGQYADAAHAIEQALHLGAQPIVGVDAAEAWYRHGDHAKALRHLRQAAAHATAEPHRYLMTAYLLHQLDAQAAPSPALIEAGLAYWQAQAALFSHTPYGKALAQDISAILRLKKEEV